MCWLGLVGDCCLRDCVLETEQCSLIKDENNNKPITQVDWGYNDVLIESLMAEIW